jgi:cytosine/adenosine deaminase-related metal-dependent hydrolase
MLIRGGRVLTMDARLGDLDPGDVLVSGGKIRAVAPRIEAPEAEVIDARERIVLPGFVDTHRHVWQTQLRTVATDWTLFDYFVRMRCVYGAFYSAEDAYLGDLAGALEALDAGITTIVDHSHIMSSPEHADEAIRALEESGIRAVFCYGLFPSPTHDPFRMEIDPGWRFDDARRVRREKLAGDDRLVTMGLAPTEVEATPFEAACAEIRFGRELGVRRISCHVAMGKYDRGHRFVERLRREGLLGADLLFVHGAALSDAEIDAIAACGASISSTPETELQMGMGHPVAERARVRGAQASLGIDIVSNFAGDMFGQMRLLLQAERGRQNELLEAPPRSLAFKAREVLELATLGGARAAGLDDRIGSITPGKEADVILVRTDAINMVPALDAVGAVVLNANVHDVDTVLVGGKVVKHGGRLVKVDWPSVAARVRRSSERILAASGAVDRAPIEALAAGFMLAGREQKEK